MAEGALEGIRLPLKDFHFGQTTIHRLLGMTNSFMARAYLTLCCNFTLGATDRSSHFDGTVAIE